MASERKELRRPADAMPTAALKIAPESVSSIASTGRTVAAQNETNLMRPAQVAENATMTSKKPWQLPPKTAAQRELAAWLAKYTPVEREIFAAHERRLEARERRRQARIRAIGDLAEATEGFSTVMLREGWTLEAMVRWANGDGWILNCLARAVRKTATQKIDALRHRYVRPRYYENEQSRRLELAKNRRKVVKRTTLNACPTREEILDAWIHVKDSHAATIRFGSLIHDLECYLDNSLRRDEYGTIIGRNSGIKGYLQEQIPALYLRYSTVMRYKAAAKKLRQIANLADPIPAAEIVADDLPGATSFSQEVEGEDAVTVPKVECRCVVATPTAKYESAVAAPLTMCEKVLVDNAMEKGNLAIDAGENATQRQVDKNCDYGADEIAVTAIGTSPAGVVGVSGVSEMSTVDEGTMCIGETRVVNKGTMDADETRVVNEGTMCIGETRVVNEGMMGADETRVVNAGVVGINSATVEILRARAIWREVVSGIGEGVSALLRRIDDLVDPRRIEDANMLAAWRERYQIEITGRTNFSH